MIRDPNLFELVTEAALGANAALDQLGSSVVLPRHRNWPEISVLANSGLPSLWVLPFREGPVDYTDVFGLDARQHLIEYGTVAGFTSLLDYVKGSDALMKRLGLPGSTDKYSERALPLVVFEIPIGIVSRLRHLQLPVDEPNITRLYEEIEFGLLEEELPVELLAPLLCTRGPDGRHDLAPDAWVEQMDEGTQMMRAQTGEHAPVPVMLLGAATHAVVLAGATVPNGNRWIGPGHVPGASYVEALDLVVEALRIATGMPLGYAQILVRPLGWADGWTAHLPALSTAQVSRRYPAYFDDRGWFREPIELTAAALAEAGPVLERMRRAGPAIRLASRRYSQSFMREEVEDQVVDACVGLEALLGEKGPETTYKLAIRAAAVLGGGPGGLDPESTNRAVKVVYDYRSTLVHGETPTAKQHRSLTEVFGDAASPAAAARWLLLQVLSRLLFIDLPAGQRWSAFLDREYVMRALGQLRTPSEPIEADAHPEPRDGP